MGVSNLGDKTVVFEFARSGHVTEGGPSLRAEPWQGSSLHAPHSPSQVPSSGKLEAEGGHLLLAG